MGIKIKMYDLHSIVYEKISINKKMNSIKNRIHLLNKREVIYLS